MSNAVAIAIAIASMTAADVDAALRVDLASADWALVRVVLRVAYRAERQVAAWQVQHSSLLGQAVQAKWPAFAIVFIVAVEVVVVVVVEVVVVVVDDVK